MSTQTRNQYIEQVAGIIANWGAEPGYGPDDARRINQETGWTFEIRFHYEAYTDNRSFTRVEGCVLTEEELERAILMGQRWARGEFSDAERR